MCWAVLAHWLGFLQPANLSSMQALQVQVAAAWWSSVLSILACSLLLSVVDWLLGLVWVGPRRVLMMASVTNAQAGLELDKSM